VFDAMEMKKINSGKLRAIGYDAKDHDAPFSNSSSDNALSGSNIFVTIQS